MKFLDGKIIKISCPDKNIYTNSGFVAFMDNFFAQPELQNYSASEQVGNVLTSVGKNFSSVWKDPTFVPLLNWACGEIVKFSADFGKSESTKIEIKRLWFNRMFQGSRGMPHNHTSSGVDGVAIFYISAPSGCGELVFSDPAGHAEQLKPKAKTGDLVVHSPQLEHFITEHKIEESRTVLVFEFKF